MSESVLVTGAAGFVGRHLIESLAAETDAQIVATDIEESPPERYAEHVGESVEYIQGDVTDKQFLDSLFEDEYERVFHFAAVVGVDKYVSSPLEITDVNIVATRNILEQLQSTETRLVFTSTSEVYGKNPDVPWSETTDRVLGPATIDRWSYSTSKSACEHMIHGVSRGDSPFTATVVRPFNLYGPGQRPKFVIPAFVEEVVTGGTPTIYDDGSQTRCFTYIEDFIEGLRIASRRPEGANEVFNLGATREMSIRELADIVLDVADVNREPEHIDTEELYGERYEDLDRRVPDVSKANERLGWEASTPLEEGIERLLEWGQENY